MEQSSKLQQEVDLKQNIELITKYQETEKIRLENEKLIQDNLHKFLSNSALQIDIIYKSYMTCTQMLENIGSSNNVENDSVAAEQLNKLGEAHAALVNNFHLFLFQGKGNVDQKAKDTEVETQPQNEPVIVSESVEG